MPVQVIESPGLGGEDDKASLVKMANALRKQGFLNAILFCINSQSKRIDYKQRD